jgi:osmotically-inducible protein OsmY
MKLRTRHILAIATTAALMAPVASAQSTVGNPRGGVAPPGTTLTDSNVPTTTPDETAAAARASGHNPHDVPQMTYVSEPTASASKTEGADGELAKAVVDEMNADPSLKGSKITVQPEQDKVTLSGVTVTMDQAKKAGQIAASKVGAGNVTNAIRNSDM